ncbi:3-oxoacyl-[acyl-carrier-protein] synthase III C-terminal domain-containing protein [Granulicella mallensis]|uniref:3-oxoacyl-[acyl-carrier-protein] synthase III C-terminal domain-containing protein n=1 Tax=Granulicella mallensis TaxID=940614 RepID=UPI002952954B|nr:3-oxoacyl-[acyl-carrier-protein] synthase III C-terminal domain-containing protein [Granulicella mallensis]
MDKKQIVVNIENFGNTTAATIPLAMASALKSGQLERGNLVMLASVGAGFSAGATLLRWET